MTNETKELKTYTMQELYEHPLEPMACLVDGLLAPGLYTYWVVHPKSEGAGWRCSCASLCAAEGPFWGAQRGKARCSTWRWRTGHSGCTAGLCGWRIPRRRGYTSATVQRPYCYRQRGKHSLSGQISRRSLEDVIISLEECVERIESSSADPLRRQACFCFLTTPFLFAAEYMADFGNKALEARLKSCAWLLYYSHDRECIRARRVLKVLGFHLGTLYLREKAKARYRKRRPK